MTKKCVEKNVDLPAAFANGDCAAEAALGGTQLAQCVEEFVECEVCQWANLTDEQDRDCDEFDNGVADGSCVAPGCEATGSTTHSCTLDPNNSALLILGALPLDLPLSGELEIACDSDGGVSENCSCNTISFDPVNIFGLGTACLSPFAGCQSGQLTCVDDLLATDLDMQGFHSIGACDVEVNGQPAGNPACAELCDAHCPTVGPTYGG